MRMRASTPLDDDPETSEGPPSKRARPHRYSSERSLSPEPHEYSNFAKFQATHKEQPHPKPAAETYAKEPIKVSSWSPTLSSNPSGQESAEDSCERHDSVSMYRGQPLCYPQPPHLYSQWGSSDDDSSIFSRTDVALVGLRDLVLSVNSQTQGLRDLVLSTNAQTQAMMASMSSSIQALTAKIKEQKRRPALKKRKSDQQSDQQQEEKKTELQQEGAIFANPQGSHKNHVILEKFTQNMVVDAERKYNSPEKLARALLLLLFSPKELATGNCTKPTRPDIQELDSERLWAIKCHIDYVFPLNLEEEEKEKEIKRWTYLLQKVLNPICRHHWGKQ